jgi:hypothetical protein
MTGVSERSLQPSLSLAATEHEESAQHQSSSALEWEQAKAICRERLCAESHLRFHLRHLLMRLAQAGTRMEGRLRI